jgi:hypothetical protein
MISVLHVTLVSSLSKVGINTGSISKINDQFSWLTHGLIQTRLLEPILFHAVAIGLLVLFLMDTVEYESNEEDIHKRMKRTTTIESKKKKTKSNEDKTTSR